MKTYLYYAWLIIGSITIVAWIGHQIRLTNSQRPALTKPIYDETADGSKQITTALFVAKNENKRVLLQFGANWCVWCHKVHNLFDDDVAVANKLKTDFVVVLIDVSQGHNQPVVEKYGEPTRFGLPVIVILAPDGRLLTTKRTDELATTGCDCHDPEKVLAFLNEWTQRK